MRDRDFTRGLAAALHGAALPFGYTLTVWGSGTILTHARGTPGIWEVALFVTAAAAAFELLRASTRGAEPGAAPGELAADSHLLRAGTLQGLAIATALASAALLGLIPSFAAWPAGGFCSTSVYLLGTAAELALRTSEQTLGA